MPSVQLRYPHARLLIFNLLHHERTGCTDALIKGAYSVGLIVDKSIPTGPVATNGKHCGSLVAARQIVQSYFAQRHDSLPDPVKSDLIEQVVSAIEKDVASFKSLTGLVHPKTETPDILDCGNMAPVVFDILLQQLHPYE